MFPADHRLTMRARGSGAASAFPAMMTELDDNLGPLHLESYGLSVTTMEEVFLKVAQHGDKGFIERQASLRRSGSMRALRCTLLNDVHIGSLTLVSCLGWRTTQAAA